jgi:hypothetical protein
MSFQNKTAGTLASTGGKNALGCPAGRKTSKGKSRAAQRSSLETVAEIEKSRSAKVRISISNWRGEAKIEIRETSSVIPGIYFPTSSGVTIPFEKLPELIEAILAVERKCIERGPLGKAERP